MTALACGAISPAPTTASDAATEPMEASAAVQNAPVEDHRDSPRLILWLTIDQMRGDYLAKYSKHFSEDGFRRILDSGVHFTNAHYAHAITETAPGHATLFTGTSPRVHGIIGNSWLLADGTEIASVEDQTVHATGPGKTEEDEGRSPLHLLAVTLGDELVRQTHGKSKVVAFSSKDRAAVLPAGKVGTAYWLGSTGFISSTDYAEDAPGWLYDHHEAHPPSTYLEDAWDLILPESQYENPAGKSDWAPGEWSNSFPHHLSREAEPVNALLVSPFGDEAVIDGALAAVAAEGLGQDDATDLLSISLSSTDLIGHLYGPESREMEDQIARLDRQLARLLRELEKNVSPEHTLIVLSSDHGGCESADYHAKVGRDGRRLREADVAATVQAALKKNYSHDEFLLGVQSPYVFLKRELILERQVSLNDVRAVVAEAVSGMDRVHSAHALNGPRAGDFPEKEVFEAIHLKRSGDVYVVPAKHTLFLQRDSIKATHGSPWEYDTHVPIIISGAGVEERGERDERVDVRSLVPTVASIAAIDPPPRALQPVLRVVASSP